MGLRYFFILICLMLFGCSPQRHRPSTLDWYENIETRERVRIASLGTLEGLLNNIKGYKKSISNLNYPVQVIIWGDSSKAGNEDWFQFDEFGGHSMIIKLYSPEFFEMNFTLIKAN